MLSPRLCVVPRPLHSVTCLRIRSGTPRCPVAPLRCIPSCRVARFLFVLLCCVRRTGGWCVCCVWSHCGRCVPFLFPSLLCVCCHSIVGLGLCVCDRVVSLWNSGGGLCWVEGRVVYAVHCQLLCVVACVSVWCVLSCCAVLRCVGWRWSGRSRRLSSSSLFVFLFLAVGVRGSARAALRARTLSPNTIASPLLCLSCLLFSSSSPFFTIRLSAVEWRWVIHHVSVCCVGMTAIGSLSRSSSFFW